MSDLVLNHTADENGNSCQISLSGRLAIDTVGELHRFLMEHAAGTGVTKLDLTGIEEIDLTGLQLICSACHTNLEAGGRFVFSSKLPESVAKISNLIGLQMFTTCKYNKNSPCIWCGGLN